MEIKKATRESYGEKLAELGEINKDIVVLERKLIYLLKNFLIDFLM